MESVVLLRLCSVVLILARAPPPAPPPAAAPPAGGRVSCAFLSIGGMRVLPVFWRFLFWFVSTRSGVTSSSSLSCSFCSLVFFVAVCCALAGFLFSVVGSSSLSELSYV